MKFVLKAKKDLRDCDNDILYKKGSFYTDVIDNHFSLVVYGENNEFNEIAITEESNYNWVKHKELNEDFEIYILKEDIPLREYAFVIKSFKPENVRGDFEEVYNIPAGDEEEAIQQMYRIGKVLLNALPNVGELRFNEYGYSQGHYITDTEKLMNLIGK